MKLLQIEDNSKKSKDDFKSILELTDRIANKTMSFLEKEGLFVFPETIKDAEDLEEEQFILREENNKILTGNIMGFVGCGEELLVIRSRFSKEDSQDFFLRYLLSKVLHINAFDLKTNAGRYDLFEMLLILFPYLLKKAMRKGLYKTYIRRNYNDFNVRGTIDIARHIRENSPFVGKIAYSRREFSYDNELMELVRHTIEYIRQRRGGSGLLAKVKDEVAMVISATPGYVTSDRSRIIRKNQETPVRHAYYYEYRKLQQLCIMILKQRKSWRGSDSEKIYGILFDGAWLWEEYVNTLIGEYFYHPKNRAHNDSGVQWLFQGNGSKTGMIYPDFIGNDPGNRLIADAKYKSIENINCRDYLQVLAYMFRFDAKKGFFLYPESKGSDDRVLRMNKGVSYENNVDSRDDVLVVKCGLKIPQNEESYESFKTKMEASEQEFMIYACGAR